MTAETLAQALLDAHPGVEPFDVDGATVSAWVAGAGADPDDDRLVAAALVAWDLLLG